MKGLYEGLHKAIRFLLFMILSLMVIVVTAQIFCRYVIFYSLSWSEEFSRYLFAWLILIGASLSVEDHSQICIDIIEGTRGKVKKVVHFIQYTLSLVTVGALFVSGVKLMKIGMRQLSPAMRIPMSIVYLCMPIGFVLLILEIVVQLGLLMKNDGKTVAAEQRGEK